MSYFRALIRLQLKRFLRQKAFLICLFLMPLLGIFMGVLFPASSVGNTLKVGILLPADSGKSEQIWRRLLTCSDEQTEFIRADSENQVREQVAARVWECGYLFAQNFDARLDRGDYKGIITRVMSPASMTLFTSWTVVSALFEVCAPHLAMDFLKSRDLLTQAEAGAFLLLWEEADDAGLVKLRLERQSDGGGIFDRTRASGIGASGITRGLMALLLFVFAYLWAVQHLEDTMTGFFQRIKPFEPATKRLAGSLTAAGLLMAAGGGLAVAVEKLIFPAEGAGLLGEVFLLTVYILSLACLSFILTIIIPNRDYLLAVLPFFLILCLLLSPILFDAGQWIREIRWLSNLIPLTHYLRAVTGGRKELQDFVVYTCLLVLLASAAGYAKAKLSEISFLKQRA